MFTVFNCSHAFTACPLVAPSSAARKSLTKINVSSYGNLSERLAGLIESNVFFDHVPVCELDALGELLFPPTVVPVADAGFSL